MMKAMTIPKERTWTFTDRIKISLHGRRPIEDCKLEIKVFEGDYAKARPSKRNRSNPVGVTEVTGHDLMKLLSQRNTTNTTQQKHTSKLIKATLLASGTKSILSSFELHSPEIVLNNSTISSQFHGLIELQGKIKTIEESLEEEMNVNAMDDMDHIMRDEYTRLLPLDMNGSIIRQNNNREVEFIYLHVVGIKSLSSDFFGNFFDDR